MSASILDEFDQQYALNNAFTSKVAAVISELLTNDGISIHSITWRVKTRESLAEKIARPDKAYGSLSDLTDICGVRITTYFAGDVDLVGGIIAREFEVDVDNSLDKRALLETDRFGYLSVHQVVSFDAERLRLRENQRFTGLRVEIQTRSILQHAWAEIEHDLGYKATSEVPKQVRRRFSRLAGLLELVDDEFSHLRNELRGIEQALAEKIRVIPELVPLDVTSLRSFLQNDALVASTDAEIVALSKTWTQGDYDLAEQRAREFLYLGITNIGLVGTMLKRYSKTVIPLALWESDGWLNASVSQPRGNCLSYLTRILVAKTKNIDTIEEFFDMRTPDSFKDAPSPAARNLLERYIRLEEEFDL